MPFPAPTCSVMRLIDLHSHSNMLPNIICNVCNEFETKFKISLAFKESFRQKKSKN